MSESRPSTGAITANVTVSSATKTRARKAKSAQPVMRQTLAVPRLRLSGKMRAMPRLPDAFVCANDFLALNIMTALKQQGISIPDRVMVSGFDGMPQTGVVDPALTTAQIPNAEIARLAAELLLARIDNPGRPLQRVYVETKPILRKSTAPRPAK